MNVRRARFIDEYLRDGNGAAAARRAGYSEKSAKVTASRLLTNDNVQSELARKQAERQAVLNVSRDVVVRELLSSVEVAKMCGDSMTVITAWSRIAAVLGFTRR